MEIRVPVRLFALPTQKIWETDQQGNKLATPRVSWSCQAILGADAVKLYADDDPTLDLNGSREKLEAGAMIDVDAVLRLYPRKSGIGVQLQYFAERGK